MFVQLKNPRLYIMILIEAVIFIMAFVGAYLLRFEFIISPKNFDQIMRILPWLVPVKLAVFFAFGLYKGMWRYSGIHDFWRLAEGCLFSSLLVVTTVLFAYGFAGFSRAVFLLDGLLSFMVTGGSRMAIRTYYSAKTSPKSVRGLGLPVLRSKRRNPKRVLIVGAGRSGEKLLREIYDNPNVDYEVMGFLDDSPDKRGRAIHGVPVFGPVDYIGQVLDKYKIDQVFISIPSATGPEMRRIVETCKSSNASFKTLPAIGQIIDGKVSIRALRDVNYEDLLRRAPLTLDTSGIENYLRGRKVVITGAGGSIGSELCRQVIRFHPEELILVDSSEANLYKIQMELRHELHFSTYRAVLAMVQDESIMRELFDTCRPEVVLHAAAYKQVPMLEENCRAAVYNNVLGSQVAMETAIEFGVRQFVLVSTDKAVRPTSVMGASKRLAEIIMQSLGGQGTQFKAVRFGNVVGSSGSVVPLFRRQIELGGPVTITHPEITRYFMTIPEAAQLIIQAGALAEEGEIFILEMGTPVKITEMARELIRLSGKEPGREIEIKFIGLRPGEKLYEELITDGEDVVRTGHDKIMAVKSNGVMGKAETQEDFRQYLNRQIDELLRIADSQDPCAVKRKLKEIIPEYNPEARGVVFRYEPSNDPAAAVGSSLFNDFPEVSGGLGRGRGEKLK